MTQSFSAKCHWGNLRQKNIYYMACCVPIKWGVFARVQDGSDTRVDWGAVTSPFGVCTCCENPFGAGVSTLKRLLIPLAHDKEFSEVSTCCIRLRSWCLNLHIVSLYCHQIWCLIFFIYVWYYRVSIIWIFLVYIPSSIVLLNVTGKETVLLIIYQCDYQTPISTVLDTLCHLLSWL